MNDYITIQALIHNWPKVSNKSINKAIVKSVLTVVKSLNRHILRK